MPVQVICQPCFNYARDGHSTHVIERGAVFESKSLTLQLMTPAPLELCGADTVPGVKSDLSMHQGERMTFVLRVLDPGHASAPVVTDELEQSLFEATVLFWHQWVSQSTYVGRWREMVTRSALLLNGQRLPPQQVQRPHLLGYVGEPAGTAGVGLRPLADAR